MERHALVSKPFLLLLSVMKEEGIVQHYGS